MSALTAFARFLYDFVVGDDWTIAVGVAAAIGLAALVVNSGFPGWWLPPIAVISLLTWSLWRATGSSG